jgi:hypothetical protein
MFVEPLLCAKIKFNTIINPAFHAQDRRYPKKGSVRLNVCQIHMLTKKCFGAKKLRWSYTLFRLNKYVLRVALVVNL